MVESQPLLIRADANAQIGSGHVMRCLALAQAWIERCGAVHFAYAYLPYGLADRLAGEGIHLCPMEVETGSLTDAESVIELAKMLKAEWIVVDGYHFGYGYQQTIKERRLRLLMIDDYGHAKGYVADLILNQNAYASDGLYPRRAKETELLLGARYALLRREFWNWQDWKRPISNNPTKLLVTLGGGDVNNVTLQVTQAIQLIEDVALEVIIVVGGGNPHLAALQGAVRDDSRLQLVHNVDNMPELMAWADAAISAAGSTCWELAFMGLPGLLIVLAENQRPIADYLVQHGINVSLGWYADISERNIAASLVDLFFNPYQLAEMSKKGRALVDGNGAKRVVYSAQHYAVT